MSTLAEIEAAVEELPASEREALLRSLQVRLHAQNVAGTQYRTITHPGGFKEGFDFSKLGQLPEDF